MAGFKDRAARLDLSFPLEFEADGETVRGHCLNISESGLLASFPVPPELWTQGELRLHFGESAYELKARVARLHDNQAGMSFTFRGEADRTAVRTMLAFAAANTHLVGLPPF